ncbi:MAG: PPC domain-containing protein [Ardenticatenaceae bacterium]|nr:PPC domain-containing protein [Ardenticatenaceae bacterium]
MTWPLVVRTAFFSSLLIVIVACQPGVTEEGTLPPPSPTALAGEAAEDPALPTPTFVLPPTLVKPATPTPLATTAARRPTPENWQIVVNPMVGLSISAPSNWVNGDSQLPTAALATALGQEEILLLADSLETGSNLLTGRPIIDGAFAILFWGSENRPSALKFPPTSSAESALAFILNQNELSPLDGFHTVSGERILGVSTLLSDDPSGVILSPEQKILTRITLFFDSTDNTPNPIFLITGSSIENQEDYLPILEIMSETVRIERQPDEIAEGIRFLDTTELTGGIDASIGNLQKNSIDFWAFEGVANRFATITLVPGEQTRDLILTLISPSGRLLVELDSGFGGDTEILADYLLGETGVYTIQVREFFNEPDRYTLTVALNDEPTYSGGGTINFNQELRGQLLPKAEDVWTFNGQANQNISIILQPLGEFDPLFTLLGPDGDELATFDEGYSGDAEILGNLPLPVTGEYRIVVRSFSENGGQYTLTLDEGNEDVANFYEAGDLIYGDARREVLRESEIHVWYLTGRAGDQINLNVTPMSETVDLDVWLLDPERRRQAVQDSGLAGEAETINFTLPRDGQYIVLVQEFFGMSGEYEIQLTVSGENYLISSGTINYGDVRQSALPNDRGTIWQFGGEEGDIVTVRLSPINPESDFLISLRDPDDQPILQMDNNLAGQDEVIADFELTADGLWAIVVQEFSEDGGLYTLSVEKAVEDIEE